MGQFNLMCASPACGNVQGMEGPKPQLGVDLLHAAAAAGWVATMGDGKITLFCSAACQDKNITKANRLRRHLR